jgi:hypothetical protein
MDIHLLLKDEIYSFTLILAISGPVQAYVDVALHTHTYRSKVELMEKLM